MNQRNQHFKIIRTIDRRLRADHSDSRTSRSAVRRADTTLLVVSLVDPSQWIR
jgi:hypothetical protein